MTLWKYNRITGYWNYERGVTEETAQQWLDIFQKTEPKEYFQISKRKPKDRPNQ